MEDGLSTWVLEMTDQKDVRLETFLVALKRLHLAQRQLTNFRDLSKTEIRKDRHKDAEYSITWMEKLERDLPDLKTELAEAFGALDPGLKTELAKIICGQDLNPRRPH